MKLLFSPNIKFGSLLRDHMICKMELVLADKDKLNFLQSVTFDHRYTKPFNLSALDVLAKIARLDCLVQVGLYTQNYFKWKAFPVNAYKPSERLDMVFFNSRQLSRPVTGLDSWEETLWHELVHVADHLAIEKFDHGDNKLRGKDETAPVKFARLMAQL